jgi:putative membrane protein insertion efficiency factor
MDRLWAVIDWPFKWTAYFLIQAYRYTLSSIMGRNCRHAPSCSEFTRDAILRHGFWPGGWMGAARIWRCRPRVSAVAVWTVGVVAGFFGCGNAAAGPRE